MPAPYGPGRLPTPASPFPRAWRRGGLWEAGVLLPGAPHGHCSLSVRLSHGDDDRLPQSIAGNLSSSSACWRGAMASVGTHSEKMRKTWNLCPATLRRGQHSDRYLVTSLSSVKPHSHALTLCTSTSKIYITWIIECWMCTKKDKVHDNTLYAHL